MAREPVLVWRHKACLSRGWFSCVPRRRRLRVPRRLPCFGNPQNMAARHSQELSFPLAPAAAPSRRCAAGGTESYCPIIRRYAIDLSGALIAGQCTENQCPTASTISYCYIVLQSYCPKPLREPRTTYRHISLLSENMKICRWDHFRFFQRIAAVGLTRAAKSF